MWGVTVPFQPRCCTDFPDGRQEARAGELAVSRGPGHPMGRLPPPRRTSEEFPGVERRRVRARYGVAGRDGTLAGPLDRRTEEGQVHGSARQETRPLARAPAARVR